MMIGLTTKQRQLLDFIKSCEDPPSYAEMQAHMGLASKSGIHRLLVAIEQRGHIRRLRYCARAIEVVAPAVELSRIPTDDLLAELNARGLYPKLFERQAA